MKFQFWTRPKTLRMVWRVEKHGNASHLVGTAHFFPCSFRNSLTSLMRDVDTVMFEGPLDDESSARISEYGRSGDSPPEFIANLTQETIDKLDRLLRNRMDGQFGDAWFLRLVDRKPIYFEAFTDGLRPFAAFFSLWQTCLDWKYSVDMEGYQIARNLNKQIRFLETIEEQLEVLDNISSEHIARYLNEFSFRDDFKENYVQFYLDGNLDDMIGLTRGFATRSPILVSARDQILFERMKPIIESECAVAFVGFPHIPGVVKLFQDEGYTIWQERE